MIEIEKYKQAVEIINKRFEEQNISDKISTADILFGNQTIAESIKELRKFDDHFSPIFNQKISNIIFNHYYPEPTNTTFYHFTTLDNFKSILSNSEIWLFSLTKRFDDEEFRLFYVDHQMEGYQETKNGNRKMEVSIMEDTFYASFSRANELSDEESLWNSFGGKGTGVRVEFDIKPKICDFRNVYYETENDSKLLLQKINSSLKKELNGKVLLIPGLSKIGAFYIKGDFETETETRLIIKKVSDSYDFDFQEFPYEKSIKYIKLKFESRFASIKILSVKFGEKINRENVEKITTELPKEIKIL
jgi:hypothetical protein